MRIDRELQFNHLNLFKFPEKTIFGIFDPETIEYRK